MADLWQKARQTAGNATEWVGDKLGLKEGLWSETIAGGPTKHTSPGIVSKVWASEETNPQGGQSTLPPGIYDQYGNKIGSSNTVQFTTVQTTGGTKPPATNTGGDSGGGGGGGGNDRYNELAAIAAKGDLNPAQKTEWEEMQRMINESKGSQGDSAAAAAEARRRAALAKYEAQVGIAQAAKTSAKESYDWLVNTIGSNKQDLLEQVALQEKSGLADYQMQEDKTRKDYDRAKQEILSTYRDLQQQQEKIMRGSGMGSSSRSQEATLRLSNLLGKDLSTVRTNEADSLAMIGNALTTFKEKIGQTNISIEREATGKLDKAAVDYNNQIRAIDANLTLSAAEREEAYAQAEIKLAEDSQAIEQWATGLKLQAQQTQATMQSKLDDFIVDMLNENGSLNAGLTDKRSKTNDLLTSLGYTPMDTNPTVDEPGVGVYQKAKMSYKDKASLDAALAAGEITPADYQAQLSQMQMSSAAVSSTVQTPLASAQQSVDPRTSITSRDPLLSALFA